MKPGGKPCVTIDLVKGEDSVSVNKAEVPVYEADGWKLADATVEETEE